MSTKLTTITDKIIERADAELKDRIDAAAMPLDALLRNGCSYEVSGPAGYDDNSPPFKAMWYRAMNALKAQAFTLHRDKVRQEAIDAFEKRVATLERSIESFRNDYHEQETP